MVRLMGNGRGEYCWMGIFSLNWVFHDLTGCRWCGWLDGWWKGAPREILLFLEKRPHSSVSRTLSERHVPFEQRFQINFSPRKNTNTIFSSVQPTPAESIFPSISMPSMSVTASKSCSANDHKLIADRFPNTSNSVSFKSCFLANRNYCLVCIKLGDFVGFFSFVM